MTALAKTDSQATEVTDAFVQMVERAAANPAVDVDKLERLLAMRERMEARRAEDAFNEAMAAAQAEMQPVRADANNPQTKSRYASYAALDRALRPLYTKHGFSLSFDTGDPPSPETVRVLCYVSCAGHTRTYKADMPADGKGAKGGDAMTKTHAAGAAFSYGARYLLKMIFNVAVGEHDNDGNMPPGNPITEEQVKTLQAAIMEVDADLPKFLRYLKIERIDDLPASKYQDALAALQAKRKAAKAKEAAT